MNLRLLSGLLVAACLGACAPTPRFTLLPEADGKPSAVLMSAEGQTHVLNQPYQTGSLQRLGGMQTGSTTAEAVQAAHGALLQLRPPAAQHYTLNFVTGGTALTPESAALMPEVITAARARAGGEVVVLGHTKCGAVTAVVKGDKLGGSIPKLVEHIIPAAERAKAKKLEGDALIDAAIRENVMQSIHDLQKNSEEITHLIHGGKLKIVGAVYNIESGEVEWL